MDLLYHSLAGSLPYHPYTDQLDVCKHLVDMLVDLEDNHLVAARIEDRRAKSKVE